VGPTTLAVKQQLLSSENEPMVALAVGSNEPRRSVTTLCATGKNDETNPISVDSE
jgi:hypothetical protein